MFKAMVAGVTPAGRTFLTLYPQPPGNSKPPLYDLQVLLHNL